MKPSGAISPAAEADDLMFQTALCYNFMFNFSGWLLATASLLAVRLLGGRHRYGAGRHGR